MRSEDDHEIRRLLLEAGATPDEIEAAVEPRPAVTRRGIGEVRWGAVKLDSSDDDGRS